MQILLLVKCNMIRRYANKNDLTKIIIIHR